MKNSIKETSMSKTARIVGSLALAKQLWKAYKDRAIEDLDDKIKKDSLKKAKNAANMYTALQNKKMKYNGKMMTLSQIKDLINKEFSK